MTSVEQTSVVTAPAEVVWDGAVTEEGINYELRPILRMTMPRRLRGEAIDTVPVGEPLGRAWLLLFGFLPVDYDDLTLAERGPGLRFLESSSMLTLARWRHERTVEPDGDRARVTDRLGFELRRPLRWVPGAAALASRVVAYLFRHRHRRLAARYGGAA
jgi:ligand-binding SRPBCC domain-containing protein